MDSYLLIFIIAVIILFIIAPIMRLKPTEQSTGSIKLSDIPALVEELIKYGTDGSFWFISIPDTELDDDLPAKLALSIEGEKVGLNWTLLTQRNKKELPEFENLIQQNGLKPRTEINKTNQIRIENAPDFAQLIQSTLTKIFNTEETTPLPLVKVGIKRPKT